jgi:O-antigen ligase
VTARKLLKLLYLKPIAMPTPSHKPMPSRRTVMMARTSALILGGYLATFLVLPGQAIGWQVGGTLLSLDRLYQLFILGAPTLLYIGSRGAWHNYRNVIGRAVWPLAGAAAASLLIPLAAGFGAWDGVPGGFGISSKRVAFFLIQYVLFAWSVALWVGITVQYFGAERAGRRLLLALAIPLALGGIVAWVQVVTDTSLVATLEQAGVPIYEGNAARILRQDLRVELQARMNGTLPHAIDFAVVMGLGCIVAIFAPLPRGMKWALGVIAASGLVFSFSRGPVLALIIALLIIPLFPVWNRSWGWSLYLRVFGGAAAVATILALWPALRISTYLFPTGVEDQSTLMRLADYPAAIQLFLSSPVTGIGMGIYEPAMEARGAYAYGLGGVHLDNYYLKAMVEMGGAGLAAFIWLFASRIMVGYRAGGRWGRLLAALTVFFAVQSVMFDSLDFIASTQLYLLASTIVVARALAQGRGEQVADRHNVDLPPVAPHARVSALSLTRSPPRL